MTENLFDLLGKEADRQERQIEMARLIGDMAYDNSIADIVAECVRRYGAVDAADVVREMTDLSRRNGEGDDALEVLTRVVN